MKRTLTCLTQVIGVAAIAGMLSGGAVLAQGARHDDNRPPQTLPQGFESIEELQRDAKAAENEPVYSAWLVESSPNSWTYRLARSCRTGTSPIQTRPTTTFNS